MRSVLFLLVLAGMAMAAGVPVATVSLYQEDTLQLPAAAVKFTRIIDRRVLSKTDARLLGSASVGVFQERARLQNSEPVAVSVERLLQRWLPGGVSDTSARRLQIEILSCESWTDPSVNPAKASARVFLRFISADSAHPGRIAEASGGADRDGPNTADDEAELLRLSLRRAMLAFLDQDWKTAQPVMDSTSAPQPDPWTDALKRAAPEPVSALRTLVHLSIGLGLGGYDFCPRATAYHEPETGWNTEYWATLRLRDPSFGVLWESHRFDAPTVMEMAGGIGWQRRLGADNSSWVTALDAGGIFGNEWHDDHGRRQNGPYLGADGRAAMRWEPVGGAGISGEAGVQTALRFDRMQIFNLGLYLEGGWRF